MEQQQRYLQEIVLVGLTTRTNNTNELNPSQSKIAALASNYWGNHTGACFKQRKAPGVTYAVYTHFEDGAQGDYTYFIGEAVHALAQQDLQKFTTLTIPASQYTQFTTEPGPIPEIIINAWQKIWQMGTSDWRGKRSYIADFEVYDDRAADPSNAVVDIFIGLEQTN